MNRLDTTMGRICFAVAALLIGLATGCAASSDYMQEVKPPQPLPASPDAATVVFLRPSSFGARVVVTVLDDKGEFIGDSVADSHFAVKLKPGRYLFIGWAENTSALQADVLAGRTYYVEVAPKMGALFIRAHLLALKPGTENWVRVNEWLRDTRQHVTNHAAGQSYYFTKRQVDVRIRMQRAQEVWAEYSPEEREARLLRAEDGVPNAGQAPADAEEEAPEADQAPPDAGQESPEADQAAPDAGQPPRDES